MVHGFKQRKSQNLKYKIHDKKREVKLSLNFIDNKFTLKKQNNLRYACDATSLNYDVIYENLFNKEWFTSNPCIDSFYTDETDSFIVLEFTDGKRYVFNGDYELIELVQINGFWKAEKSK